MSSDYWTYSATEIVEHIKSQNLSAVTVIESHLDRISATNGVINAVVTLSDEAALSQAKDIDKRVSNGEQVGLLAGVPIGVKDVTATLGIRTTFGSPLFADHIPDKDDIIVQRIKEADGIIIGKTNSSSCEHCISIKRKHIWF